MRMLLSHRLYIFVSSNLFRDLAGSSEQDIIQDVASDVLYPWSVYWYCEILSSSGWE